MKQAIGLALAGALLASTTAYADTVTGEVLDTMPGKGVAGVSGFLVGGFASGGPAGALVGGVLGWILGDTTQQALGVGDTAYRVETADGKEVVVRSPNQSWATGDEVRIVGNRLVAASTAMEVSSR